MTGKICKLLCLILIFSCTTAAAQTKWIGREKAEKLAESLFTETVIAVDNMGGHFWVEAVGNAGSVLRMHIEYKGFYIRPILTMTQAKQGLIRYNPDLLDKYEIVPQSYTVNITVSHKKVCRDSVGEHVSSKYAHMSEILTMPPPPPKTKTPSLEVADWMYKTCGVLHKAKSGAVAHSIVVESRQADGKQAYCHIFAEGLINGARISFGQNAKTPHENIRVGVLDWILDGPLPIEKPFSLQDMLLSFNGTTTVPFRCGLHEQTITDTSFTLRYDFVMAPMMEIKAELEPADSKEKTWIPTPGETREYRLRLVDPGPDKVDAVKFVLSETSRHKGIVTNGGNHMRGDQCPDCTLGVKDESWPWEVFFPVDGADMPLMRHYTHYNECPIDSLPDVFFTDADNSDYIMGDDAVSENLRYTVCQSIETDKISGDTYTAKLRVMDGAASAKLQAYVKVGGLWYAAAAKGDTADSDGIHLLLPLDKDHDGLQDTWEKQWGAGDPDADDDSIMGNPNRGDGLTVFEEYRGVYAQGRHFRLSPVYIDVFVHDYSGNYNPHLREVGSLFRQQEINLWRLAGNEFKYDCINYDDGEHKNGDQYIIVVMDLNQCPGVSMEDQVAGFTTIGPPGRNHNTLIMLGASSMFNFALNTADSDTVGTLAHEIGHQMGLPHHGDTEGLRTLNGKEVWIACLGGQHSGDEDCFMKYNCAQKFIALDWVPQTNLGRWLSGGKLVDYTDPYKKRTHFCNTPHGSGQCGDATEGGCLGKIKIKSY